MNNKLLIAGAALFAVAGAGAGLYWQHGRAAAASVTPVAAVAPKVAYVNVEEMTLRLADTGSEHYIKLTPVLAVRLPDVADLTNQLPVVRDQIVSIVSSHASGDLATPAGQAALKQSILAALHHEFHDDVVSIYFSGYLVE